MKTKIVTTAALLAAILALPLQARDQQERAPRPAAASLILAQSEATCPREERRVPQGTTYCDQGRVVRCSARGSWEKTDKRC